MNLLILILSLPTENATARMRAWRALKTSGAAVLRDGVYLMPATAAGRPTLDSIANAVQATGGSAYVFELANQSAAEFSQLFDRSAEYAALQREIAALHNQLSAVNAQELIKSVRKLRKAFNAVSLIDFFPDTSQQSTANALQELEFALARIIAPDEPVAGSAQLIQRNFRDYRGRIWATRQRPWVDRLACAWLIRRFIDPEAQILWLNSVVDCPATAIGFDFDGAEFSHLGHRVSFEVMLASFELQAIGLQRLAAIVHYLDVGGIAPPEAAGVETILAGLRNSLNDDDQLLRAASPIFDALLSSFATGTATS
ncbi:chromate resistance protein [Chitinibacter fontanus]|uniref:Chromate resistance protein n=1 Tax=Chitinibacter fontanus TaxID=1737446 RepID=A0A7D5V9A3_9NEIS|nr:chromate resistance protein ChrB domain-containing protein [Chitinibacter fontanus]QLI80593.1 chromate resistance protein [Chitinibacter fontanus]